MAGAATMGNIGKALKTLKIELPCDPATPLLGIHPTGKKISLAERRLHPHVHRCLGRGVWKQPSVWRRETWALHTTEHHPAAKRRRRRCPPPAGEPRTLCGASGTDEGGSRPWVPSENPGRRHRRWDGGRQGPGVGDGETAGRRVHISGSERDACWGADAQPGTPGVPDGGRERGPHAAWPCWARWRERHPDRAVVSQCLRLLNHCTVHL